MARVHSTTLTVVLNRNEQGLIDAVYRFRKQGVLSIAH